MRYFPLSPSSMHDPRQHVDLRRLTRNPVAGRPTFDSASHHPRHGAAVWSTDTSGGILSWSPAAATLLGAGADDVLGRPLTEVLAWDSPEGVSGMTQPIDDGVLLFSARVLRRPGRSVRVAWSHDDPGPGGLLCAVEWDPHHAAALAPMYLRPHHRHDEAVLICDENATILHAVAGRTGLLGYARHDLVGRTVSDLVCDQDVQAWFEMWAWTLWSSRLQSVVAAGVGPNAGTDLEFTATNELTASGAGAVIVRCRDLGSPGHWAGPRPERAT